MENELVYDKMIALAATAREKGINVAFAFLPKSDVNDDERYAAVVTNCNEPALLDSLMEPIHSAAVDIVGRDADE